MSGNYKVIFDGKVQPGFDIAGVKRSFGERFRVPPERMGYYFSGKPITLKQNLSREAAERLFQALTDIGARAYMESEQEDALDDGFDWGDESPFVSQDQASGMAPPPPIQMRQEPEKHWDVGRPDEPERKDNEPFVPDVRKAFLAEQEKHRRGARMHRLGCVISFSGVVVLLFLIAVGWYLLRGPIQRPPGILVAQHPIQNDISNGEIFFHKAHRFEPLADFQLEARVLSKRFYDDDRSAQVSPYDLALGWGQMSDSDILRHFDISQSTRFYFWRTATAPISTQDVILQSSNMHMIPADKSVLNELKKVRKGDIIALRGKLVMVTASDGFIWKSSLQRKDTGNGACEIIWVEDFRII